MLHPTLYTNPEKVPTRHGFGEALLAAAKADKRIVGLCADLTESTRMHHLAEHLPEQYIQVGVAEQNMISVAAGLALSGKIPFAASYATFSPGRSWDQVRVGVCYNQANVKFTGHHAGLLTGPDGATHEALEDIAIMRVLPGMTVFVPSDYDEAYKVTMAAAKIDGPVYIRLGRAPVPKVTTPDTPFAPGKILRMTKGKDLAIFATGVMVYHALIAANMLKGKGISVSVYNVHTIKPLDIKAIVSAAKSHRAIISAEEHQIHGGLGSAVAEVVSQTVPTKMGFVGVQDTFAESGDPETLLKKYGLSAEAIVRSATKLLKK